MTKILLSNNQLESLMKGRPTQVGGMKVIPTTNMQRTLRNIKKNGWSKDVNVLLNQDKKIEIRMRPFNNPPLTHM